MEDFRQSLLAGEKPPSAFMRLRTGSERIDRMIGWLKDWRGKTFADIRKAIVAADPDVAEDWECIGAVWSCSGRIAVASDYAEKVKLIFVHGARLPDPQRLFKPDRTGAERREIEFFRRDAVNADALTALARAAIAFNRAHVRPRTKPAG